MSRSLAGILEHVFTTADPDTGSPPPAQTAWVIFGHGTIFYTGPSEKLPDDSSFDMLVDAAHAALNELGPVQPGSSAADFNPIRLARWFSEEPVWLVAFDHENIATVVTQDAAPISVGLIGRANRQRDFDERSIVLVRDFNGKTRGPALEA